MNRRIALALTTFALSGLILSAGAAAAQQKSLKEQLVGAWTFVSAADSDNRQLFGPNSKGVMILDASGQYAQIIVRPDVPKFATNNRLQGTPEENKAAVEGTTANFGTWTVARYRGMKRKTWETVNASTVEAIPKRTSNVIHPDALRADAVVAVPAAMSGDYRAENFKRWRG